MKRNGVKSMLKEAARRSACVCVAVLGGRYHFYTTKRPTFVRWGGTLVARYAGGGLLPK